MQVDRDQLTRIFKIWQEECGVDRPDDFPEKSAEFFEELLMRVNKEEQESLLPQVPLP